VYDPWWIKLGFALSGVALVLVFGTLGAIGGHLTRRTRS
jgi:hypothetical protein